MQVCHQFVSSLFPSSHITSVKIRFDAIWYLQNCCKLLKQLASGLVNKSTCIKVLALTHPDIGLMTARQQKPAADLLQLACLHSQKRHSLDASCGFYRLDASLSSSCIKSVDKKSWQSMMRMHSDISPWWLHATCVFLGTVCTLYYIILFWCVIYTMYNGLNEVSCTCNVPLLCVSSQFHLELWIFHL